MQLICVTVLRACAKENKKTVEFFGGFYLYNIYFYNILG